MCYSIHATLLQATATNIGILLGLVNCWLLQNLSLHMNKQWAHNDFVIYASACFVIRSLYFRIVWTVILCLALRVENQIHLALKLSREPYSKKLLKKFWLCGQIFGNKIEKEKRECNFLSSGNKIRHSTNL